MKHLKLVVLGVTLVLAGCDSRRTLSAVLDKIVALEQRLATAEKTIETLSIQTGKVPGTIRARQFVVVDENGKAHASLGADECGSALFLHDENEKPRARLDAGKDGPRLTLWDENGKTRAWLGVSKHGPWLILLDENEKMRARLGADKDGPMLTLCDGNGKIRATLGATGTKTPDGKTVTYPESTLTLFGPDGNVLWQAPQ